MKKGISILILGIAFVTIQSCKTPKNGDNIESIVVATPQVDSLEQARMNRLDSASQVKAKSNTPSSSFTNPPKTVKKKAIKN